MSAQERTTPAMRRSSRRRQMNSETERDPSDPPLEESLPPTIGRWSRRRQMHSETERDHSDPPIEESLPPTIGRWSRRRQMNSETERDPSDPPLEERHPPTIRGRSGRRQMNSETERDHSDPPVEERFPPTTGRHSRKYHNSRGNIADAPSHSFSEKGAQTATITSDRNNDDVQTFHASDIFPPLSIPTGSYKPWSGPLFDRAKGREVLELLYRMNIMHAEMMLYKNWMKWVSTRFPSNTLREELSNGIKQHSEAEKNYMDFKQLSHQTPSIQLDPEQLGALFMTAKLEAEAEMKIEKEKHGKMYNSNAYQEEDVLDKALQQIPHGTYGVFCRHEAFGFQRIYSGVELAKWDDENNAWHKKFLKVCFAVSGGLALIIPVLIMTLHPTQLTALLTTSVFVVAVAIILTLTMADVESKDIVGYTAAYAAVLVVFVGTAGAAPGKGAPRAGIVAAIVVGTLVAIYFAAVPLLLILFWRLVKVWKMERSQRQFWSRTKRGPGRAPKDKRRSVSHEMV